MWKFCENCVHKCNYRLQKILLRTTNKTKYPFRVLKIEWNMLKLNKVVSYNLTHSTLHNVFSTIFMLCFYYFCVVDFHLKCTHFSLYFTHFSLTVFYSPSRLLWLLCGIWHYNQSIHPSNQLLIHYCRIRTIAKCMMWSATATKILFYFALQEILFCLHFIQNYWKFCCLFCNLNTIHYGYHNGFVYLSITNNGAYCKCTCSIICCKLNLIFK